MADRRIANRDGVTRVPGHDKNPLRVLPAEWHGPVAKFIAVRAYLIPDQLGFCVTLMSLVTDYGLTLADARVVLGKLAGPEFGMESETYPALMADLNRLAFHAINGRRRLAQMARRREVEAEARANPGSAAAIIAGLADRFTAPEPPARGVGAKHE